MNELLDAALAYARYGWQVHPLHGIRNGVCTCRKGADCGTDSGKHPRLRGYQDEATADPERIRQWWNRWPEANVGLLTGQRSGLIVLDVDPDRGGEDALAELEAKHGRLPDTIQVLSGGGGQHFYFRRPDRHVQGSTDALGPGIEVKADTSGRKGTNIVAPPSKHISGRCYTWEASSDPADGIALAEAPAWLLGPETDCTDREDRADKKINPPPLSAISASSALSAISALSVQRAIDVTLPNTEGQRNKRLLNFAGILKAIPGYADKPLKALKPVVRQWHQKALPTIETKAFDPTWSEFVAAWPGADADKAMAAVAVPFKRAKHAPDPSICADYDDANTRLLVRWCRELQRDHGQEPFHLACRTAGFFIGMSWRTASARLKMLVADEVLAIAVKHTTYNSTRYYYVAEDAPVDAEEIESF